MKNLQIKSCYNTITKQIVSYMEKKKQNKDLLSYLENERIVDKTIQEKIDSIKKNRNNSLNYREECIIKDTIRKKLETFYDSFFEVRNWYYDYKNWNEKFNNYLELLKKWKTKKEIEKIIIEDIDEENFTISYVV